MKTSPMNQPANGFRTPLENATLARFGWLIGMRWIFVLAIVVGAVAGRSLLLPELPVVAILVIASIVGLFNLVMQAISVRLPELKPARRQALIHLLIQTQVVADWVALLALIHYTGGVESPLLHFYIFHVAISAIFLSPRFTIVGLLFIMISMSMLFVAESSGLIPRVVLAGITLEDRQLSPIYIANFSFWYFSTLVIMAMLLSAIMRSLRRREREALRMRVRLEEANLKTSRISEERVRLMHTMGHELRSPIAAVVSMLNALMISSGPDLPEPVRRIHDRIKQRLDDLTAMIGELLELAERRRGSDGGRIRRVNLCALLASLCEELEARVSEAGLSMTRHCSSHGDFWISAHPAHVRRIFENLLSNAIKYSRTGGEIHIRSHEEKGRLHVEIQDEGIGIAPDQIDRLFTEFYRTPQSRRHTSQGTGLGLTITKELIENAGGRIEVRSEVGTGSVFEVILPLAESRGD